MNSEGNDGGEKEMETAKVKPTSLSDVAAAHKSNRAGDKALGTGLEARGVHAWFGDKHVLNNISLDISLDVPFNLFLINVFSATVNLLVYFNI